jgi:hypothetical protein
MKCARADKLAGPWEVTTISEEESLGIGQGYRLKDSRRQNPPFELNPPDPSERRSLDLHQGGIVETPSGEWWGFSMQDHNSVGRLTSLSPVTWVDGWPYFGLPGNLKRSPSIWVKPNTGAASPIASPYQRSDDTLEADSGMAVNLPDGPGGHASERLAIPSAFPPRRRFLVGAKLRRSARSGGIDATTELDGSGLKPSTTPDGASNSPYAGSACSAMTTWLRLRSTTPPERPPASWSPSARLFRAFPIRHGISQFAHSLNGKESHLSGPDL